VCACVCWIDKCAGSALHSHTNLPESDHVLFVVVGVFGEAFGHRAPRNHLRASDKERGSVGVGANQGQQQTRRRSGNLFQAVEDWEVHERVMHALVQEHLEKRKDVTLKAGVNSRPESTK
jgi:hypothetical protein